VAEVGRIQIEVDARQVDKAVDSLNKLGISARKAGNSVDGYTQDTKKATRATSKMTKSSRTLTRALGFLGVGVGGLTFGALARQVGVATTQLNNIEATMRVAAGSSRAASEQLAFIREESERLGLFLPAVAKQMAQFSAAARGTSITSEELKTIFTGISEASRAMGLTAPETEGAMKALQQMMSKGKVSAEELRQQLGERMPGSIQIMAASLDVTTQELFKMMENGELLSDEVLPKFGRELQRVFGGEAEAQANKLAAAIDRLRTSFFDLMAQDEGLPGASRAINRLAKAVSSSGFQKGFDQAIQFVSNFMAVIAQNLDHIIEFAKLLGGAGLGAAVGMLIKGLGILNASLTSFIGRLVATNTATVTLVGSMTALSTVMARIAGPIAIVTGAITAFELLRGETQTAAAKTKIWADELERVENTLNGITEERPRFTFEEAVEASQNFESLRDRAEELRKIVSAQEEQGLLRTQTEEGRELNRVLAQLRAAEAARNVVMAQSVSMMEDIYDPRRGRARAAALEEERRRQERLLESQTNAINVLADYDEVTAAALEYRDSVVQLKSAFEELNLPAEQQERILSEVYDRYQENIAGASDLADETDTLAKKVSDFQSKFGVLAAVDPQVGSAFELREQLSQIKTLRDEGLISQERSIELEKQAMQAYQESSKEIDNISKSLSSLETPMSKAQRDAKEIADAIEGDLSDSITDVIMNVESLSDAFASLARQIARTIIQQQIANPLAQGISGFASGALANMFGGAGATTSANVQGFSGSGLQPVQSGNLSMLPQNANGGNVYGGAPSIVGERGPELFVPGQDGRIIPNHQMGGGGDVTVNIINQGGEQMQAEQQQTRRGPNGEMTVDVMVKSSMERLDAQGQLDGIFRRHGARRQGQF